MEKATTSREGARAPPARPRPSAAKTGKYNKPPRSSVRSPASSRSSSTSSSRSSSTASSRSSSTASSRSSSVESRSATPEKRELTWIQALKIWNKDHNQWCVPRKGSKEYDEVEKIRRKSRSATTSLMHSTHTLSQSMRDDTLSKFRFT